MLHELIYTSAPRGLRSGSAGYSTVARTAGMPDALADQLERLSVYQHLAVGPDPAASGNPVAHGHAVVTAGHRTYNVLSRVADSGLDYSGRGNYLAHHVAFESEELPTQGPGWVCQRWPFEAVWDRPPGEIPAGRSLPRGTVKPRPCKRWEKETGDAGWAGVLAAATDPARPAHLVFRAGQDVLGLVSEALALLPPDDRWQVTFNTFYTKGAGAGGCQWRCVLVGSPEARAATANPGDGRMVLRVDRGELPKASDGPLVEAARTGVVPRQSPKPNQDRVRVAVGAWTPPEYPVPPPELPEPAPAFLPQPEVESAVPQPKAKPPAPAQDVDEPAPGAGVQQLLVGLGLGALLAGVAMALFEVGTRGSLLRHLGVKGRAEEQLGLSLAERAEELRAEQDRMRSRTREIDELKRTLTDEQNRWVVERVQLQGEVKTARDQRDADRKTLDALHKSSEAREYWSGFVFRLLAAAYRGTLEQNRALTAERDRPVVGSVTVRLDKPAPGGKRVIELFRLPPSEKPRIEVLGLAGGLTARGEGARVAITGPNNSGFAATLEARPDGSVVVEAETVKGAEHPFLGLAVIRVTPSDGRPAAYRQLFHTTETTSPLGLALLPVDPDGVPLDPKAYQFSVDFGKLLPKEVYQELIAHGQNANLTLGRAARVLVDNVEYELGPGNGGLEFRRTADQPPMIRMTLRDKNIVVTVTPTDATRKPQCQILAAEVIREIEVPNEQKLRLELLSAVSGFPILSNLVVPNHPKLRQELLRVR